jgi:hypothetical protein
LPEALLTIEALLVEVWDPVDDLRRSLVAA